MATILKHGDAELVRRHHQRHWSAIQHAAVSPQANEISAIVQSVLGEADTRTGREILREVAGDLVMISIPIAVLTQDMVDEFNACLETTGRIANFQQRVEDLQRKPAGPTPGM